MTNSSFDEAIELGITIWATAASMDLDRAVDLLPSDIKVLRIGYERDMMFCYIPAMNGGRVCSKRSHFLKLK